MRTNSAFLYFLSFSDLSFTRGSQSEESRLEGRGGPGWDKEGLLLNCESCKAILIPSKNKKYMVKNYSFPHLLFNSIQSINSIFFLLHYPTCIDSSLRVQVGLCNRFLCSVVGFCLVIGNHVKLYVFIFIWIMFKCQRQLIFCRYVNISWLCRWMHEEHFLLRFI